MGDAKKNSPAFKRIRVSKIGNGIISRYIQLRSGFFVRSILTFLYMILNSKFHLFMIHHRGNDTLRLAPYAKGGALEAFFGSVVVGCRDLSSL